MASSIGNIAKIPELRKRILFTLALLAVYRVGIFVSTPGANRSVMKQVMRASSGTFLGLFNMFSGGALEQLSIFALGIMPYISASIILQLLTVVVPSLDRLQKEGQQGQKKINQYTRYGTVILSLIQAFFIARWLEGASRSFGTQMPVVAVPGIGFELLTMVTLTTGTAFIMWLGEQISERGIGNGISLIIFAGIVVGLPNAVVRTWDDLRTGQLGPLAVVMLLALMCVVVAAIVLVERAQRKIPIQYARRIVGRRVYGGSSTYLPLRVNTGGVIPVIFASSMLAIPQTLLQIRWLQEQRWAQDLHRQIEYSAPLYNLLYFAMIIFFCFFYVSIIFNPMDQADNMKKYGGFIPGIRPGRRTAEYIDRILTRLTFGGAIYLGLVSILPVFLISGLRLQVLPGIGPAMEPYLPKLITQGLNVKFFFGGTSLLIVVGVAMDTVQQIESQLIMRHYEGFMKGARIRGRRG